MTLRTFNTDGGVNLVSLYDYSKDDVEHGIKPKPNIDFDGEKGLTSAYDGTKTLCRALVVYFEFLKDRKQSLSN